MNLLVEKPTNEIAGYVIKTDFQTWVNLQIALNTNDVQRIFAAFLQIFENQPSDIEKAVADAPLILEWLGKKEKQAVTDEPTPPPKKSFDFEFDSDVIYAELWRYFPQKMQTGISYHEGIAFIHYLCAMPHEQSLLSKRVFSRLGDFSKMSDSEQTYWNAQKELYRLPLPKTEQEEVNKIIGILRGDGDLSKLEE